MSGKEYYKIEMPFASNESFNNTILLLTMIKSEYYYMIGFSRPKGQIEIGFDYSSDLHGIITESVTATFGANEEVTLRGEIRNIKAEDAALLTADSGSFKAEDGSLIYERKIALKPPLPVSIETMNKRLMSVRADIFDRLESYYKNLVLKKA